MKIFSIVNPVSGGVDKDPAIEYITRKCDEYGIESLIYQTTGEGDREAIEEHLESFQPDKIASIGGDGTTLFVASILKDRDNKSFGIVPMGSANGLALELGVKNDYQDAFKDIIMSSMTCPLDLIRVNNEHLCIHMGDVGLNAKIIKGYEEENGRGMLAYAKQFFKSLGDNKIIDVEIDTEDNVYHERGYMVAIANSRKYGTGVVLNKDGTPLDGYFEIVILREMNVSYLLQAGLSALNDAFATDDYIFSVSTNKAKLTFEKEQELQLDGEMIGSFKEIEIDVLPGAVQLITTKNNPFIE